MAASTTTTTRAGRVLARTRVGSGTREQQRAALARMKPAQRLAAYDRGELSFVQLYMWASLWPHEVPLVNGEFEFIALTTPDVGEAPIVPPEDQRRRIIDANRRALAFDPQRSIAARLRAEADRLRALADAEAAAHTGLGEQAREWLAAAPWPDMTHDDVLALSDTDAAVAIQQRYPGGLAAFQGRGEAC